MVTRRLLALVLCLLTLATAALGSVAARRPGTIVIRGGAVVSELPEVPPVAAFSGTPLSGAAPLTVAFTDASTGTPTSWAWQFGDGGTSTAQNPSHQYAAAGNYTVTLATTNPFGSDSEVKAGYVTVTSPVSPPVAAFSGTPLSGTAPLTVAFTDASTGSPTSWAWQFGDGGTSTAQNPSRQYAAAGTYTVTLTATNAGGSDPEVKTGYVTVTSPVSPPVAAFSGTPLSGQAPLTVAFTDASTGTPTSWAWQFGDGGTSTAQNPSRQYAAAGTYTVTLTATNAGGSDAEVKTGYVTVSDPPPPAARVTDGLLALYLFDAGSGSTVNDVSGVGTALDLTVADPGNVTWIEGGGLRIDTATNVSSGAATKINNAIISSDELTVEMWLTPATLAGTGSAPNRILSLGGTGTANFMLGHGYNNGSPGDVVAGRLLGNANEDFESVFISATMRHVVYTRATNGVVHLYVDGDQDFTRTSATSTSGWAASQALRLANEWGSARPWFGTFHLVAVYDKALSPAEVAQNFEAGADGEGGGGSSGPPIADFSASYIPGEAPRTVTFTDTSTGSPTSWAWTFGDGGTSTAQNPSRQYSANGTYTVSMTATNASGSDTETKTGYIVIGPVVAPVISGVTGSVADGASIVIAGSSFGSKSAAPPLVYDNFEAGGGHGAVIDATATVGAWTQVGLDGSQYPYFNTSVKYRGAAAMEARFSAGQATSGVKISGNYDDHFYIDAWINYDKEDAAPWSRVRKLFLMFGDGVQEYPQIHFGTSECVENPSFHPSGYASLTDGTSVVYPFSVNAIAGGWHHLQTWVQASDNGIANGKIRVWLDGVLRATSDAYLTVTNNTGNWDHLRVGYYHAHDEIPGLCDASPGDAYVYWDNVYVDNTPARVEIGNAATYAACTLREIQIPSAWSTTSISATVNTGAFADGGAWLYVVNGNGVVSTVGYPIDVANSPALQYAAITSATVNMAGGKMQAKDMQLHNGAVGTVTVRYVNNVTDAQIGTTKTAGPGNLLTVAGVTVADGVEVRIEYTLTTETEGYLDVTSWTDIAVMEMANGAGDVSVFPALPE
jgi:PKD repeat protein